MTENTIPPSPLADAKFATWFGQSKVVDQSGQPLLCFHGTDAEVTAFRPLTHFGSRKAAATYRGGLSHLHAVYLKIERPCLLTDTHGDRTEDQLLDWAGQVFKPTEYSALVRASIDGDPTDPRIKHRGGTTSANPALMKRMFVEYMRKDGYDGVQYVNRTEDPGHTSWVIFDSDQVWRN